MTIRALLLFGSSLLLLTPMLAAQGEGGSVDQKVEEMRRQVIEGKVIRSHVRVTVRLKNGNRIKGVVKNGFLVERVDGLRFVAAEKDEAGAGLRLFYWNGKNNFVFLPFNAIDGYKVNERLTASQLASIELETREREERERRSKDSEAARDAARAAVERAREQGSADPTGVDPVPAGETEGGQGPGGRRETQPRKPAGDTPATDPAQTGPAKEGPANSKESEVQGLYKLLQEFPPAAGWNKAKRDEISRRMAVVGARPSPVEQKFVDKFAEWELACKMFGVEPTPPQPEEQGSGRRRSRR